MPPASNVIDLPTSPSTTIVARVRAGRSGGRSAAARCGCPADGASARPSRARRARGWRAPRGEMLVLVRELLRLLAERVRRELVRRHVREVARAVRPLGDDRGALDGGLQLGIVGVTDDDPLERLRSRPSTSSGPANRRRGSFPRRAPRPARVNGTGSDSSSSQTSVPPTRASDWAAAAPAVRSASTSTSSRLPTPAATRRGASSSPSSCRRTASPRSPRSSPLSPRRTSRPPSFSSTIFAPSPPSGCATGRARASAPAWPGSAISTSVIGARWYRCRAHTGA